MCLTFAAALAGCPADPPPPADVRPMDATTRPDGDAMPRDTSTPPPLDARDAVTPPPDATPPPPDAMRVDTGPGRCISDVECPMARPWCDPTSGECVECLAAPRDTCPSGQYCDTAMVRCRAGCRTNADCMSGGPAMRCDTTTHTCVGCLADPDCAPGTVCQMGACVPGCTSAHPCAVGATCCGSSCINTQTDAMNCGACGTACAAGQVCCSGRCASLDTDPTHCGTCGTRCALPNATPVCMAGSCTTTSCAAGYADCDNARANGCEVNTARDTTNCGRCGNRCPSGPNSMATCAAGACGLECSGGFGDCDASPANGCEVAFNSDASNCGRCGNRCTAGANATASCAAGMCVSRCNAGFGDCDGNPANGCETNLNTTPTACGGCGTVCSYPNGSATCSAGTCGRGACFAGFGDCDGNVVNGCETPTVTNMNCGACGAVCAAGTFCSAGVCSSICSAPTTFCAGACVNTATDPSHCGACGSACPPRPNAISTCTAGACSLACSAGFGDCDRVVATGCEVALGSTVAHCGACGNACPPRPNAPAACVGGACSIGACNAGFANCNGSVLDGCETNTTTDVANCGACGNACPARPNAATTCAGGACGIGACSAGFANCNGSATDGCEVNTNTSNANCGGCGVACGPGTACSAGVCSSVCGPGLTYCLASGTCVNLNTDNANCGSCGTVCAAGTACSAGACRTIAPPNDLCANATPIDLSLRAQTLTATTTGAAHNLDALCTSFAGADVFFRFTLAQPELVYADTFGASWDTVLFLANSCTAARPLSAASTGFYECNDDAGSAGCTSGGLQSQIVAYLPAGTYYLVVAGYNSATGTASVRFQHSPVGNNAATSGVPRLLPPGSTTQTGTTSGTGLITASSVGLTACWTSNPPIMIGAGGGGPEQSFFWKTCPEFTGGAFTASSCNASTTFDTYLYQFSVGAGAGDCNDDSTCAVNSLHSALPHPGGAPVNVPAGPGLHVFVVDGYSSSSTGTFNVSVTRP